MTTNKTFIFTNGTYDLETNEFKPSEQSNSNITNAGYNYLPLDDQLIQIKEKIHKFFRSIVQIPTHPSFFIFRSIS